MTGPRPSSPSPGEGRGPGFAPRLLTTLGILTYAVAVPILEVNPSHLTNPFWPPHARTHEAWQVITNSALGTFAAWRLWRHQDLRTATIINGLVMGSFLIAHALQSCYGGSMGVEGRGELSVFGVNLGVGGFLLALGLGGVACLLERGKDR